MKKPVPSLMMKSKNIKHKYESLTSLSLSHGVTCRFRTLERLSFNLGFYYYALLKSKANLHADSGVNINTSGVLSSPLTTFCFLW